MNSLCENKRPILFAAAIFIVVFIYTYFFLEGLRLFDNDYNQWLKAALSEPFLTSVKSLLNPVLSDWNVDFRPFQTVIFKALYALFGYGPGGYYLFKAFMAALFCATYFLLFLYYFKNFAVAFTSALFVGLASSTYTSLYWVSDFVIVSEFIALVVYALFLRVDLSERPRKVISTVAALFLVVILTVIADRTKANGKLIVGVIFLYLLISGAKRLYSYWPMLLAMGLSVVPLSRIVKSPVPTFIYAEPGVVAPYSWQPASAHKLWLLFASGFEPLSFSYATHPPISILSIMGFLLVYVFIAAIVFLIYRRLTRGAGGRGAGAKSIRETFKGNKPILFFFSWGVINFAAMLSYPKLPEYFQARYAISFLIPVIPLVLLAIYSAVRGLSGQRGALSLAGGVVLALLLVVHVSFHSYQSFRVRINFPTFMIASDTLREFVSESYKGRYFYYLKLPVYSYRVDDKSGNIFISSIDEPDIIRAAGRLGIKPNDFLLISVEQINDPTLVLIREFPGVSDALFDKLFNSGEHARHRFTFYLYQVNI